ncbi:MAG: ABC transporter substrate-binding protein [Granulosicoccus sp.]
MSGKFHHYFFGISVGILTLVSSGAGASQPAPSVLSINLCADQMVMLLAEPAQIKALSMLSHDKAGSFYQQQAKEYPVADARAEDILPRNPDIVLTGPFTPRHTLALLAELELDVKSLEIANSVEAMLENIRLVGEFLQQEERAASVISSLQNDLAKIETRRLELDEAMLKAGKKHPKAAVYDANGYTVGASSMRGSIMSLAGWHNVATDKGIEAYGVMSLEDLIHLSPDALIESPYSEGTYSRGQVLTEHPALRQSGLDPLILSLPSNQTICAGPWSVGLIEQLLDARQSLE